jgi:uncharacterized membrane protein (GlpM family)
MDPEKFWNKLIFQQKDVLFPLPHLTSSKEQFVTKSHITVVPMFVYILGGHGQVGKLLLLICFVLSSILKTFPYLSMCLLFVGHVKLPVR